MADPADIREVDDPGCVKGCYRCLLSYYNQPDHELIDRTDEGALRTLLRLARGTTQVVFAHVDGDASDHSAAGIWREALGRWGLPRPDVSGLDVADGVFELAWRSHLVAASLTDSQAASRSQAEAIGYTVLVLPAVPGAHPPLELIELLGAAA
jgi:hypothetical protein